MSWLDQKMLLTLANLCLCAGIGWICLCRVTLMDKRSTRQLTRIVYALVGAGAAAVGCWYWITGEFSGWDNVIASSILLLYMASGARAWKGGVPSFAKSDRAPLDTSHT